MAGVHKFLPTILSLISILLVVILIVPGVNNGLTQIYYLKTETSNFNAAAKLAGSTFLQGISDVSGADLVGSPSTAQSMGLAKSYTIHLLTICSHAEDGQTSCTAPHVGFTFDPAVHLQLDSTSLQGNYTQELLDAISNYSKVSRFLGLGYVVAVFLLLLGTMSDWFSERSRMASIFATLFGLVATILMLAGVIVSALVFKKVNDAYNSNFNANGLTSSLGSIPIALGAVALVFALLSTSWFVVHARNSFSQRGGGGNKYRGSNGKSRGIVTGADPLEAVPLSQGAAPVGMGGAPPPKPGLWGRIPTWSRHTYVQVEKQPALGRNNLEGQRALVVDHDQEPEESVRRRLDDDWATRDDYSHAPAHGSDPHSSIPMLSVGNNRSMDQNTAYEPYKDKAGTAS